MTKLDKWVESIDWSATYTCDRCGKVGQGYYVQPQPQGGALCVDCINVINKERREERKRQLDAMPRCEVPGCTRRATVYHPNQKHGTGLCGIHWRRAKANIISSMSPFALFETIIVGKEDLIKAAQKR